MYFGRLKELTTNPQLTQRLRFMVRDVLDLRTNNWIPRREEVDCHFICLLVLFCFFLFWGNGGCSCAIIGVILISDYIF